MTQNGRRNKKHIETCSCFILFLMRFPLFDENFVEKEKKITFLYQPRWWTSRSTNSRPKPSNAGNEAERNVFSARSQRWRSFIFSFEWHFVGNKNVRLGFAMTRPTRFDTRDDKTSIVQNQTVRFRDRSPKKSISHPTLPWPITHTFARFDLSTRNDEVETFSNSSIMIILAYPSCFSWRHMIEVQMVDKDVHANKRDRSWCENKSSEHHVQLSPH